MNCMIRPVLNASNVDPNQVPNSVTSDMCIHCLPKPISGTLGINGLKAPCSSKIDISFSKKDLLN